MKKLKTKKNRGKYEQKKLNRFYSPIIIIIITIKLKKKFKKRWCDFGLHECDSHPKKTFVQSDLQKKEVQTKNKNKNLKLKFYFKLKSHYLMNKYEIKLIILKRRTIRKFKPNGYRLGSSLLQNTVSTVVRNVHTYSHSYNTRIHCSPLQCNSASNSLGMHRLPSPIGDSLIGPNSIFLILKVFDFLESICRAHIPNSKQTWMNWRTYFCCCHCCCSRYCLTQLSMDSLGSTKSTIRYKIDAHLKCIYIPFRVVNFSIVNIIY